MENQKINQIHFEEIRSTQEYLVDNKDLHNSKTLISTDLQTKGTGQYGRNWDFKSGDIAFSAIVELNEQPTLTSLEMAVIMSWYLEEFHEKDISFKWPNDLLNSEGKKVGGILLNKVDDTKAIIGVGLNCNTHDDSNYNYPAGSLDLRVAAKIEALNIYQYILTNRQSAQTVINEWESRCVHLNKNISIKDGQGEHTGTFVGVGQFGQAKLDISNTIQEFYSGSIIRF